MKKDSILTLSNKPRIRVRQTGGDSSVPQLIVEKGEYVKTTDGEVLRVSDKAPTHGSTQLQTSEGTTSVSPGKGGLALNGLEIESVVSATQENRRKKDKAYTSEDESISISPNEAITVAQLLNMKLKKPKGAISPAKLIDLIKEEGDALSKKYQSMTYQNDSKSAQNSMKANSLALKQLPELPQIYDTVFEFQENKRIPTKESTNVKETGGKVKIGKGDTLGEFATRYKTSVDELAALNGLSNPNLILENDYLNIPSPVSNAIDSRLQVNGLQLPEIDMNSIPTPKRIIPRREITEIRSGYKESVPLINPLTNLEWTQEDINNYFNTRDSKNPWGKKLQVGGKALLNSFPIMQGTTPVLSGRDKNGKPVLVNELDGRLVSMDTVAPKDSVEIKGKKAFTKLAKYIKK